MPPFFPPKSEFNKMAQRAGKGVDAPTDDAGHTLLHAAAKKGDLDAAARLLQLGANPRQLDAQGQTPLYAAVAARNIALVKLLIDNGANFRAEDDAGYTPLLWAIEKKADVAFLEHLRGLGIELDFQGTSGRGALQAAAAADSLDVIDYLLKNKVPVDAADQDGKTALHNAIENGAHNAMTHLLAKGANPLLRTKEIKTPLYLAAAKGDEAAVDILLALPEVRQTLNDFQSYTEGFSPLMAAVNGNNTAIVKKLINLGANVNQQDNQNRHSLFIAVETGTPAMVEMLIRHGADVEKAPRTTPATQSAAMLHKINPVYYREILLLLYKAGANLNDTDSLGQTALYKAADARAPEKVKALLDLGADPDLGNSYGRRPIDAAISAAAYSYYNAAASFSDAYATVSALLAARADPNLSPAAAGVSAAPLHVAARSNHPEPANRVELVKLLLDHGAIVDEPERISGATPWLAAVAARNLEACELLRQRGADTAKKDNQGRSVLHLAAQGGAKELLEAGLRNPALQGQIDKPDASGYTPLHIATRYQKADCVSTLFAAGANYLSYDGTGLTALHLAATSYSDAMFSLYETTLGKKANWNIQSRDEKETPLHLAAKSGSQSIVGRLLAQSVNVTLRDRRGFTPLTAAIAAEQYGTVALLIDHLKLKNISLDEQTDNSGLAPLHHAALRWPPNGAALLLAAGADVNIRNAAGETPLHVAVRNGNTEIVRLLITRGADMTLTSRTGMTPLDVAVESNRQNLVSLLQQALKEQQQRPPFPPPPSRRPPHPPSAPQP